MGDSRIYRLRGDTINQLTFDHSLQWELKASGQLPEGSDIAAVVPKNVITRSLGPNPSVQIDLEGPHAIAADDVYLLCSDGLTGRVEDEEIGAILGSLAPTEAAQALIDLANLRGGPDNVTVLIGRVSGPELVRGESAHEPLRLGGSQRVQPVNTTIWIVAVVCAITGGTKKTPTNTSGHVFLYMSTSLENFRERISQTQQVFWPRITRTTRTGA